MKNKKGAIISIWWFLVMVFVAGGVAAAVLMFYYTDQDVRYTEADILANRVLSCLNQNGFLMEEGMKDKDALLGSCGLEKTLFDDNSDFFLKVSTKFTEEGSSMADLDYSRMVFEFEDGRGDTTNFFYKYEDGIWKWGNLANVKGSINLLKDLAELVTLQEMERDNYVAWESFTEAAGRNYFDSYGVSFTGKNKNFMDAIKPLNFSAGIMKLVDRALANQEGGWFSNAGIKAGEVVFNARGSYFFLTERVTMDKDGIFTIKSTAGKVIYIRWFLEDDSKWQYSLDKKDWHKGKIAEADPDINAEQRELISAVSSRDYENGLVAIFVLGTGLKLPEITVFIKEVTAGRKSFEADCAVMSGITAKKYVKCIERSANVKLGNREGILTVLAGSNNLGRRIAGL